MSDLKLYEYPLAIAEAYGRDEAQRALDPEHAAARHEEIDKLEGARVEKIEHVAMHVQTKEAEASIYKEKADDFMQKYRRAMSEAMWCRDYLHNGMKAAGKTKIRGTLLTVSLRKNPVSCKVIEQSKVPDEWQTKVITYTPKKVDMIAHYKKTGEMIEGVEFIDDRKTIVIR